MALSNIVKNQFDSGKIELIDGAGTVVEVHLDDGTFAASGLKAKLRETVAYQSRGTVHALRHTSRTFPTGSFNAMLAEFSESGTGTILDFIHGQGPYSGRTSTMPGDVQTFDVKFTMEGNSLGDSGDHTITLEDCELIWDVSEGDPNAVAFNWTCYGDVSGDIAITN